ncbi:MULTISPECIES: OprO/OprP family phosphate-selective porin [unclassified Phenylobacterium]|uniref:OprO/OprP family phosphate-selective porin n=1 Tax=unclassified Phenylobacterium TaxID=2640670 RepID=UPI0022B57204|nr:porin [Phenylobacterium sp. NIBR 498073]MBS0491968.1 porin [Pseudomonadota bacterium]WGU39849.1 porin [Phenylobacterium sp. NIBR 498073]
MKINTSLCAGAALGVIALAIAGGAQAQDTTTAWKGAPLFQNDTLTFKVRGRVYEDFVHQEVDRQTGADFDANVTRLRTARLGVEGTWNANWAYKAEFTVAGGSANWEDLILEYKPTDSVSIMAGNFKTVSFENISSSRYTTFMERGPFNDVLDIGRVMNVQVKANGENWTAAVAVSGDSLNNADPTATATGGSEVLGVNGRVTWVPINGDATKLHVGAWARYRDRQDQANFNYQARNNTNYGARYISTGAVGVADTMVGLEGVFIQGPFAVQAEWAKADVDRLANVSSDFTTYYVAGSWFVTGEMKNLDVKKGEWGRTKILNPVTSGGLGALELAVRYDNTDLTNFNIPATAGEYSAWTLGANWYVHPYVRFMANYTKSENDNKAVGADVDVETLQFRAQFDF